jgi:hypothetical protein
MPPQRCRAPRCGLFVTANTEFCRHHSEKPAPDGEVLHDEIQALRHVLARLMEADDLDMLARHIPRITSVSIQAARARHQLGERARNEALALIGTISEELDEQIAR